MVWNARGEDRVKSYRVYQELEKQYHDSLERIADLETALALKDELIRRLAAEIALQPQARAGQMERRDAAAEVYTQNVRGLRPPSGVRPANRPGAYSSVEEGTSEHDDSSPAALPDALSHIPLPKGKKN